MIHKITNVIYICNKMDVENIEAIKKNGITCIYNVAVDVNDKYHDGIISVKCGLYDSDRYDNPIKEAVNILESLIDMGHIVLIHCWMGHNRAPFIVSKYFEKKKIRNQNWKEHFKFIKEKRPEVFTKPWMEETK